LAKVIVGMTISLDGFVADQNGDAGRLYPDLAALGHTAYMRDAIEQTGAVLMGRRTFEMGTLTRTSATTNSKCRFSC
jgi:dihydrofolate reductase